VCGSPAKPQSHRATKFTLELDVVVPVSFTLRLKGDGTALRANKFRFIILSDLVFDVHLTAFESTKVTILKTKFTASDICGIHSSNILPYRIPVVSNRRDA
jgi:hypothetical protein